MLISKKIIGKENSVKSQTFPGFNLKCSSSVLIISCKLIIFFNLAQTKTSDFVEIYSQFVLIDFLLEVARDLKALTCFSVCFSKGQYANFACFTICL